MAKEVRVLQWCDECMAIDERTPVVWENEVQIGSVTKLLELCNEHAEPWRRAEIALTRYGSDLPKPRPRHPSEQPQRAKKEGDGRGAPNIPCPACGEQKDTRHAISEHARRAHGKSLDRLEVEAGLPISGRRGTYQAA